MQSALFYFDTGFPNRRGTDVHDIGDFYSIQNRLGQIARRGQIPQVNMGIQQQAHQAFPSKASSRSPGSGASKSSAILIFPFRKLGLRLGFAGLMPLSFAIGFPDLAMRISRPLLTSSTSLERCVLAS